ncbi:MAG: GGDEF domain-containing protein [Ruminococcus sp.]|nr:GGDEF domain-containing protein [Ruminococcus sp.]
MSKRKNICFITARPEKSHGKRVLDGIFTQCQKYGYNVSVVSSLTHLQNFAKTFNIGEQNIYNLIDYSNFDAVILDTLALTEDYTGNTIKKISDRIEKECKVPVVALIVPYRDFYCVKNYNEPILREMCRHIVEVHGKENICILTGPKGHTEAESRLSIFLDELSKHNISVSNEHIVYGDFWYTSGIVIAEDLIVGTFSMPEAVICASDHMALGLIEKLTTNGVKIPEDLIVIGYEGTSEAALSRITLTTYESNEKMSAAKAVDYIREQIEPGAEILPFTTTAENNIHTGMSCGCNPDIDRNSSVFKDALYLTIRNYCSNDFTENVDIGQLMESYVFEKLTSSGTPQSCIDNIYENTNLIEPFTNFYLCLIDNWLEIDSELLTGYPDKMRMVLASSNNGEMSFHMKSDSLVFFTNQMIPRIHEDCDKPYVFYFSAVHFNEKTLGYAVLQRELSSQHTINLVYRNWLRFVNSSLEMVRAKNKYMLMSVKDEMTGLYNRRGMYEELDKMLSQSRRADSLFAIVVDMDRLKYINDTYGHSEGDFSIMTVAKAVQAIAMTNERCVRAGGDEFFIVGLGDYDESDINKRMDKFNKVMKELSDNSGKPYVISASIGCAVGAKDTFDETLSAADKAMYSSKQKKKKVRE